jgi:microcin C transport system substrate-binding protein
MSYKTRTALAFLTALSFLPPAHAEPEKHTGLSLIRAPQYTAANFKHFDYVNPDAPKGGTVKLQTPETYDNLNLAIFRGNAAPGIGQHVLESLMVSSLDESSTEYCLLCEWVSYPEDLGSVTFKLREGAKWHDGHPVTPEDVIFSMDTLKGKAPDTGLPYNPAYARYYKNVVKSEKTGDREVTFTFDTKNNRELPFIVGELTIFPKHYWSGTGADGKPRDISKSTLEPPLGSGPYKIKALRPGDWIAFERVQSYWGKDLPVRIGQQNFDTIEYQYYGDMSVALEAFKANQYDYRHESSAKAWATAYDFPALTQGKAVKQLMSLERPRPMQGFALNLRRPKFQDVRVRRAFNLAFDFEWANQNLFSGQYTRTKSYFEGQELAATALPSPEELALLEPLRSKVPPEVFTAEYQNPVNAAPTDFRTHLREAAQLLKDAGYKIDGSKLLDAKGNPFQVEFMIDQEAFLRVVLPYIENLKKLGIEATARQVDSTEMKRREDNFDFDIVVAVYPQSESPGNEQRDFWESSAADEPGSRNIIGIKDPAVDALVEKIIFAPNRDALTTACRALDRVLLWNAYIVPNWYTAKERVAYWQKFGMPNPMPKRSLGFPDVWWFDAALAAKNGLK